MKRMLWIMWAALAAANAGASGLRPAAIVYGQIRDAFGIRLNSGEQVSAFLGTNEVARTTVGPLPDGSNYRLEVDVSDPLTVQPGQPKPGDAIEIRVKASGLTQNTIGTRTFAAPGNGACVKIDLVVGADSDGDGLPDQWEQMVIANSGGLATSLADIGPGKDLDGDGMADDQEFWYGSFAFLAGDALRLEALTPEAGGRMACRFLTVPKAIYRVETVTGMATPAWSNAPIALTVSGPLAPTTFVGDGDYMTFHLQPASTSAFYRLRAN